MKYWLNSIIIVLVSLMQISIWQDLFTKPIIPNITLIVITAYALLEEDESALWWVALGGLVSDLFSPLFFGIYTIIYLGVFGILKYGVRSMIQKPSLFFAAIIYLFVSMISNGVFMVGLKTADISVLIWLSIYEMVLGLIVYSALVKFSSKKSQIKLEDK